MQLMPEAFRRVWGMFDPLDLNLMAWIASAQRSPLTGDSLRSFWRYDCAGSKGVDVLAQDVAVLPGTSEPVFSVCFLSPVMAGHVVRHLAECRAHAVVLVIDEKTLWLPLLDLATVKPIVVAPRGATGFVQWPSPSGRLRDWLYHR